MSESPASSTRGAASTAFFTYTDLIADVQKRATNVSYLCHLPDVTALTFNDVALDASFPLTGATKQGMLVGSYDVKGDGKTEGVYAYAHDHVAHKGKKTQSISYFLFEENRELNEEEQQYVEFVKPFNAAYNMTGALFQKRVRLLILFYFLEKGLLDKFIPLTDDIKLFKAALASVASAAGTSHRRPYRDAQTMRAPGVPGVAKASPFVGSPRAAPFVKPEAKDDEPEFVAAVEKAPGATLSVLPVSKTTRKNADGTNRLRPVDLTEASRRTARSATHTIPRHPVAQTAATAERASPRQVNGNADADQQRTKRTRESITIDGEPEPKRPALGDDVMNHFQAFVHHIRGNFTEEDHEKLLAENAKLKVDVKELEEKLAAEIEARKKAEGEREKARADYDGMHDLKECIVGMAEQIKEGEKVKEIERLVEVERAKEAARLKELERLDALGEGEKLKEGCVVGEPEK